MRARATSHHVPAQGQSQGSSGQEREGASPALQALSEHMRSWHRSCQAREALRGELEVLYKRDVTEEAPLQARAKSVRRPPHPHAFDRSSTTPPPSKRMVSARCEARYLAHPGPRGRWKGVHRRLGEAATTDAQDALPCEAKLCTNERSMSGGRTCRSGHAGVPQPRPVEPGAAASTRHWG